MSGGDIVANGSSEDVRKLTTHSPEDDDANYEKNVSHHHQEVEDEAGSESPVESSDQLKHHEQSELAAHSAGHSDVDDGHTVPNGGAHGVAEPPDEHHEHHASDQHHELHAGNKEADHHFKEHELDTSATTEHADEQVAQQPHEHAAHHPDEHVAHHSDEHVAHHPDEHVTHHPHEHVAHNPDEHVAHDPDEHKAHHPDENVAHHSEEHTRHLDEHIAESSEAENEDRVPHVDIDIVENGQKEEDRDVHGEEEEGSGGPGVGSLLPRQDSLAGVDEILQSPAIRREIDEIIGHQLKLAPAANDLLAMQQLSDYLLPKSHGVGAGHIGKGAIIPIADVQGSDAINYVEGEQALRCKVAALYRLIDMFNWTRGFNSLMSCRISQEYEHFLVAPHGLLYSEVTAASLVRVDRQADVLHAGTTALGINHVAFKLHGALHASRPDLKCLIHLRNPTAVSVSVMKCGLLPLCPEAMELGETSFYDFPGMVTNDDEVDKLIRAFGPSNRVLIMKNFGILVGGVCVEDAFHSADSVMTACDTQLRMIPLGLQNLKIPSVEERKKVFDERNAKVPEGKRKFTKGMLEFEELMRLLDDAGYRTGYPYHPSRPGDEDGLLQDLTEVAAPPTATSFVHTDDRSRSKEKKPKVYAKDAEAVSAAQPRPLPTPSTPHVLNVQQLKERYREIRQQYYDSTIASRRETARQSKARSLSRGRKRDSSQPKRETGPSSSKTVESSKHATAPSSSLSAPKTPTSSAPAPKSKTSTSGAHVPIEPIVQATVESPRQSAPVSTPSQTPNDASTSKHTPSRTQSFKNKPEEAKDISSEKPKKSSFFERSKSLPHKKKSRKEEAGDKSISSPTKSTSSGEGVIDTSSQATPSKDKDGEEKKKKKKGFSLPSFGKKDKEKKVKDK